MEAANEKKEKDCGMCETFLEILTVTTHMFFLVTGVSLGWLIWFLIFYFSSLMKIPMLLYAAWIFYDTGWIETGTRRSSSLRGWRFWKYYQQYFPAKLIKTVDLPPDKNYIFCSFPHGILSSSTQSAFGTEQGGFEKLFPGMKCWIMTLNQHFYTPFLREYAMLIGALPASASCMSQKLGSEEKGTVLVLLVGGSHETFYSEPGSYTFNVKRRKGFVKVALKNGASLVPVLSFGEPDIYKQVRFGEGSFLRNFQLFVKRMTNIAPVIFYGRFGFTPFRRPLNTVVGEPMHLEKVEEPTNELVDEIHAKFIDKLTELFENYKHKYVENADQVFSKVI